MFFIINYVCLRGLEVAKQRALRYILVARLLSITFDMKVVIFTLHTLYNDWWTGINSRISFFWGGGS